MKKTILNHSENDIFATSPKSRSDIFGKLILHHLVMYRENSSHSKTSIHFNFITTILLGLCSKRQPTKFTPQRLLCFCKKRVARGSAQSDCRIALLIGQ